MTSPLMFAGTLQGFCPEQIAWGMKTHVCYSNHFPKCKFSRVFPFGKNNEEIFFKASPVWIENKAAA